MAFMPSREPADEPRRVEDEPAKIGRNGRTRRRQRLRFALMVFTTAVLMTLLVERVGSGFLEATRGARLDWVGASVAMAAGGVLLGALRWQIVLEALPYRLGFARALVAVLATWPLALVTPSRANDLLRAVAVRRTVPLPAGTGSVLAEKVVDVSILLGLASAGAALEGLWLSSAAIAMALLVELGCVAALMAHRTRVARLPLLRAHAQKIEDLFLAFDALLAAPARLAAASAVSLVIRGLTLGITFALLRAVDADVDLFDTCALWPVATLVGLVPVTLAGMGTRDATFLYLLSVRGHLVTRASVLAATMGYSAIAVGLFAIVGLPFMVRETTVWTTVR
jgi:glycosyltransferase 2 family protein